MRTLSAPALESAHAQETGEAWIVLMTVEHDDLMDDIRVCNNNENVLSNGKTFIALPFEIELPGADPEAPPRARVRIDNIDRLIVDTLRAIASPPTVRLQVVLASQPDVIEADFDGLVLRNAEFDAGTVSGDLEFEYILAEPVAVSMTPAVLPALF